MPIHAKILTALLSLNLLLSVVPIVLGGGGGMGYVVPIVQVLLLGGFLMGNEGVRALLMFGAGINLILGIAVTLIGLGGLSLDPATGALAVGQGALQSVLGAYMLFALRNDAVQHWMLNRSLGGSLDDV
jgi:hypothetical protein